jgi:hypothetical protein
MAEDLGLPSGRGGIRLCARSLRSVRAGDQSPLDSVAGASSEFTTRFLPRGWGGIDGSVLMLTATPGNTGRNAARKACRLASWESSFGTTRSLPPASV